MKISKLLTLTLVCSFGLLACESSSQTLIAIPNVQVGCTTSDDANCSTSNPNSSVTAYVRMTRSGCDSIDFDPVATGSVNMTCDSDGCEGVVSAWSNPDSSVTDPVTEILTGTMDVCAQVDLDDSGGLPNTGDLINEDSQNISGSTTITIDTWDTE